MMKVFILLKIITFKITDFPLAISLFFFCVNCLSGWNKLGQRRLLFFHLHFSTAKVITKVGQMEPDPACNDVMNLAQPNLSSISKLFQFVHRAGTT